VRGRRRREASTFSVSFLDVLGNTIGGLAFLLVMAMLMVGAVVFVPPLIMTESLPTGYHGHDYEVWLAAREGLGKFRWSMISGELPPGLILDESSGRLSGAIALQDAMADDRDFTFEIQCEGGSEEQPSIDVKQYAIQVLRQAPITSSPLRLVTESPLPDSYQGQPYPLAFAAEGGQTPYAWALAGTPPVGLTLTSTGVFSGVPMQTGVYTFDVSASTPTGERVSGAYRLTVSEKHPPPPPIPPLLITTRQMPEGVAERAYGVWLSAEGGSPPYAWRVIRGQPQWLGPIAGDANAFGGTPGLLDIGVNEIVLRVSDAAGQSVESAAMRLEVLPPSGEKPPPLRLKTVSLPQGRIGKPYHLSVSVIGGFPPYTWTSNPESLFGGITFDAAEGILAGTPTTFGEESVTISVTDRGGQSQQADWRLRIRPALIPLRILTVAAPVGRAQANYHLALSATGSLPPYRWQIDDGELPPGLSLDANTGLVTGVPEKAGDYRVRVKVADAEGNPGSKPLELPIEIRTWKNLRPLTITTRSIPVLLKGESQNVAFACEGGEPPYRWTTSSALPAGLRIEDGHLVGMPENAAELQTTLHVEDASGESADQVVTLTVRHMAPFWVVLLLAGMGILAFIALLYLLIKLRALSRTARRPLVITTQEIPNARASCRYSVQLACDGGVPPYRWSVVSGELPPGMELAPTGVLSGHAFKGINVDEKKEVPFTVEVVDSRGKRAEQAL
jgi:hypothetical protein